MQKVSRSIFTGLLVIAGLAACTKTTEVQQTTTTPAAVVHSVTVTPPNVSLVIGGTVTLVASVDADAGLARTVTWTSTAPSIATVSSGGLVTAVASGTVAIQAASTADPTVVGAATIVVAPVIAASLNIATVDQNGVPAQLNNVVGQLDVTVNLDPGTQNVTALYLIASNGTVTDTVATYTGSSLSKIPAKPISSAAATKGQSASASVSQITMSFNTAAFNSATGVPTFINGPWTMKAAAAVTGVGSGTVSTSINYTVANADFINATAKGDTSATGPLFGVAGTAWQGGQIHVMAIPVLYSGATLKSVTVTPDAAFTNTAAQTFTTYPDTANFAVGKDTLTKGNYLATVSSIYSNGSSGPTAFPTQMNVDNQAPAAPTLLQVSNAKGVIGQWVGAGYAFGNSTDYKVANGDPGNPTSPGVGDGSAAFWAFPKASFTALGAPKAGAACVTTGATLVKTSADVAQSAPADSTTYNLRVLQYDKLGNVRCQDLALNFGVDVTPPVNALYINAGAGTNAGAVNPLLKGTVKGYNVGDFTGFQPSALDSISGFNLANAVTQTVSVNDVTTPATKCSVGGPPPAPCSVTSGPGVLFPATGTGGINDEGYYTIGVGISDRAGNSVALPGEVIAIDRTAPLGSGGIAIPAALVGGTAISLSGTVTDNMTLMAGGGGVVYAPFAIDYTPSSSFSPAGTFGTFNKTGTATLGVPWFISDLQVGTAAGGAPTAYDMWGTDEVGLSGGLNTTIPAANITTGAGTGAGANGEWTAADFTAWSVTNAAANIGAATGADAPSVALTAQVTLPVNIGLPFTQVCFYYQDPRATTLSATPTFGSAYELISCVPTAATSDNTHWVYTSAPWAPPTSLANAAVNIIAIGYGVNGHASTTAANANIVVDN
jgi:Bacterial Ig-like domain (group 2)